MNHPGEYRECEWLMTNFGEFFRVPQFYVDVGAADPVIGSNTAFLRELGWKGLHIDGDPVWAPQWNGSFINAVIHTEPEVCFDPNPVACLSRIGEGIPNVKTRRLDDLLKEHHVDKVGLLSVDAEGQELAVLKSLIDFPNWPPFIISEYNTAGIGEDWSVAAMLLKMDYSIVHQTYANIIYYDEGRCSY